MATPAYLLAHISPLGWAHILLTGEYRWPSNAEPVYQDQTAGRTRNSDGQADDQTAKGHLNRHPGTQRDLRTKSLQVNHISSFVEKTPPLTKGPNQGKGAVSQVLVDREREVFSIDFSIGAIFDDGIQPFFDFGGRVEQAIFELFKERHEGSPTFGGSENDRYNSPNARLGNFKARFRATPIRISDKKTR